MSEEYINELKELKNLLDEGIITDEEFNKKKEQILFKNTKIQSITPNNKVTNHTNTKKLTPNLFEVIINSVIIIFFLASIFMLCFSKVDASYFYVNYNRVYVIGSPFSATDIRKVFSILLVILLPLAIVITTLSLFFKNRYLNIGKHFSIIITLTFGFLTFIFNLCYAHGSSYTDLCTLFGVIFIGIATLMEMISLIKIIVAFFKEHPITLY